MSFQTLLNGNFSSLLSLHREPTAVRKLWICPLHLQIEGHILVTPQARTEDVDILIPQKI